MTAGRPRPSLRPVPRRTLLTTLAAFALAVAVPAAGRADVAEPATTVHGVEVQPKPPPQVLRRRADAFVDGLTAGPDNVSLTRWDEPVCPLVAGLPQDQGEAVLARLSADVRAAGGPLGPRHCRANLYVVVAADPSRLVDQWRRKDHGLFGHGHPPEIRRFTESSDPVRVWYNSGIQSTDGMPPSPDPTQLGGAPQLTVPVAPSRLEFQAVRALSSVLVIAQAKTVNGVTTDQFADYVAMVALARIDPKNRPPAAPTILALFDGRPADAAAGLTTWDAAFLRGVYQTDQASTMQRSTIAQQVAAAAGR